MAVLVLCMALLHSVVWSQGLTHETAPALTDEELGHLRHFAGLVRQDLDDWRGWEAEDQVGMEAYRFQIAFMTYALSLQQYHSVPAYRDLYSETIDRLILRMIQKPVWAYWENVSRASPDFDPVSNTPCPAQGVALNL